MIYENESELITIEEMCEMLYIGKNRAYKMLNAREIQAFRIGKVWKIPKDSVSLYIREQAKKK